MNLPRLLCALGWHLAAYYDDDRVPRCVVCDKPLRKDRKA